MKQSFAPNEKNYKKVPNRTTTSMCTACKRNRIFLDMSALCWIPFYFFIFFPSIFFHRSLTTYSSIYHWNLQSAQKACLQACTFLIFLEFILVFLCLVSYLPFCFFFGDLLKNMTSSIKFISLFACTNKDLVNSTTGRMPTEINISCLCV